MKARLKWIGLIVLLGPLLGTVLHELAHLLMVWITDATILSLSVLGRVQLYPELTITGNMGAGFRIDVFFPDLVSKGLVQISGALSTFIISLIAMVLYCRRRSNIMIIFIAYGLDLAAYLAMPLHGLRRWVLFGAPYSEVIEGLNLLGFPVLPMYLLLALYFGFVIWIIMRCQKPVTVVFRSTDN